MEKEVRILLVEPHAVMREGLRLLIERNEGFVVTGEAEDGHYAVALAQRLRPDVVVSELLLPRLSGTEVARQLVSRDPRTRVLILTAQNRRTAVAEALRAGASGFVLKSASPKDLLEAIGTVAAGGSFLSPAVTHHLVDAFAHPGEEHRWSLSPLTSREREVLQLIAEGHTSKEMASLMGVSPKTVESHRSSIMTKLDIHKAGGLVRFAIREGLLEA